MNTKNHKHILSIILVGALLIVYSFNYIPLKVRAGPGQDLVIGDDETVYVVTGNEEWRDIIILGTGKLVVPSGTTLNASNIYMQSGSVFETTGGVVTFFNTSNAAGVHFNGTCAYFNVTDFSTIKMIGSEGYADTSGPGPYDAYIPVSMGGDAVLNITSTGGITIDNSTISITGGDGFDLPASNLTCSKAWTTSALNGWVGAGGNATIHLKTMAQAPIRILNASLNISGGIGGNASDGASTSSDNGGYGGGYSNEGAVSGFVGAGGESLFYLNGSSLILDSTKIFCTGGDGGKAGDGGDTWSPANGGGGGGGYSGGNGGKKGFKGNDGGIVNGHVGSGGNASIYIEGDNVLAIDLQIDCTGGSGGNAGNGGSAHSTGDGAGGGGYGGGGGGGYMSRGAHGSVYGETGRGGHAGIEINGNSVVLNQSTIKGLGGYGGNGGSGGDSCYGGGGGGGYGGGGGGGAYIGGNGGNGQAHGFTGTGGNVTFKFLGSFFNISGCVIDGHGGKGGDGGDGGDGTSGSPGWGGGGGGGGYGGGGGAGGNSQNGPSASEGGDGTVDGFVGSGGKMTMQFQCGIAIIIDSHFNCSGGSGGNRGIGGTHAAGGQGGSGGGGGYGGAGGAGNEPDQTPGNCFVSGNLGYGGDTELNIVSTRPSISRDCLFEIYGGIKGDGSSSPGTGSNGGPGTGLATADGSTNVIIPMSIPLSFSLENNSITNAFPSFTWLHLHDSTTNGNLENYTIQIDDDPNFSSPVIVNITDTPSYSLNSPLAEGFYFWRVKANYSTPPGSFGGWSDVWKFTVVLLTPSNLSIFVDDIQGEIILSWSPPQSTRLDHYLMYRSEDPHNFNFSTPYNNSLTWPDPLAANWIDPDINEGSDDANYFYIVRGVNNTGYEEQNMNIVGKYVARLNKGWNLVSIPLKQSNTSIEQVLSSIAGSYRVVYWYSAMDGKWHHSNGDFTNINHKMGFWIYMDSPDKLITNGSVVDSVIHLTEGWNLVGYPSFVEEPVDSIFSDVPFFNAVQCYNNSDTNDHWKHHSEKKFSGNDLTKMRTGFGYWVYVTLDSDWYVDY